MDESDRAATEEGSDHDGLGDGWGQTTERENPRGDQHENQDRGYDAAMRSAVAALVLPVLLLTGCTAAQPTAAPTTVTPTVASPSPRSTPVYTKSPAATPGSAQPEPSGINRSEVFLTTLAAIDPGLIANEDRALSRAQDICLDLSQGKDDTTIARNAELRYEGGSVPDLTSDQALAILNAAREYVC